MIGVVLNGFAIVVGTIIGALAKKLIPDNVADRVMQAMALTVIVIGIKGAIGSKNLFILLISMVIGVAIGEIIDIDSKFSNFAHRLEVRFMKNSKSDFSNAIITSSLIYCVGAMAVLGPLQAGINGDTTIIFTKSILDFVSAIILASTLGIGVIFSAIFVLIYEGFILIFASLIAPFLNAATTNEINAVGSLILIALGLNVLKISEFKIANFLPAIFLPIIIGLFLL